MRPIGSKEKGVAGLKIELSLDEAKRYIINHLLPNEVPSLYKCALVEEADENGETKDLRLLIVEKE